MRFGRSPDRNELSIELVGRGKHITQIVDVVFGRVLRVTVMRVVCAATRTDIPVVLHDSPSDFGVLGCHVARGMHTGEISAKFGMKEM